MTCFVVDLLKLNSVTACTYTFRDDVTTGGFCCRFVASPSTAWRLEASTEVRCRGGRTGGELQVTRRSPGLGDEEPGSCALPRDPELAWVGRKSIRHTRTVQMSCRDLSRHTRQEEKLNWRLQNPESNKARAVFRVPPGCERCSLRFSN